MTTPEQKTRPPKLAYSVPELAAASNVSNGLIWNEIADGELETILVGDRRLITPQQAESWIERKAALAKTVREKRAKARGTKVAYEMTQLERDFREFHRNNPIVYDLFKRFTNEVLVAGHPRYSSDAILHRIRWHTQVTLRSRSDYKINDNHSAYYARLWLADHPHHPDFFVTRALACERRAA